ncbi:MAG: ABC transporter ATP-binding protein [Treponema sp.]|nr:ABC transporter ATP-binding protein [Treponema sp.]
MPSAPVIRIDDLAISFRTDRGIVQAVRGISLYVNHGETLAIVGESGSGKSAAARALIGISAANCSIERGSVLFNGDNILTYTDADFDALRGTKIAMVFQDPFSSLDPIMPVGKQLTEAMLLRNRRVPKQERITRSAAHERAVQLMRDVGISEPEKHFYQYPFELSGGMRQRVVIAIAIAARPDVLICDEPTTALDVTIQAQILDVINALKIERHMAVIFITHDLGVVAQVADRVAVMYAGKIVEEGTTDDIFSAPAHPYTWALLQAVPDGDTPQGALTAIPGTPPDMTHPPRGDAFASRNRYAMRIDFEREPPLFPISETHRAATWLLHPDAPKVTPPEAVLERIARMKRQIQQQPEQAHG